MLSDGDVIPLERSGRNTEVEEVLGALSLVLNGGGVAQLKTISKELTDDLRGPRGHGEVGARADPRLHEPARRQPEPRSCAALEQVNSLAISLNGETDTLDLALEELPGAIASVDRQRDDLIKMLDALSELSSVGTRVIQASEAEHDHEPERAGAGAHRVRQDAATTSSTACRSS